MAAPQIFIKCMHCECMSGAFKALTPEQLISVDSSRTELTYKKGETLCKQGAFISNTIFIKKGLVKIYLESNEQPIIIALEKDGYFLGLSSLFGAGVFHYTAEALTDTEVCQVDVNVFRNLLKVNPLFACRVLEMANRDLVRGYDRIYSLTQKQIHGRFSELMMHLVDTIYESNPCELTITRKDIADLIHSSAESVSRLFKEFRDDKVLKANGHMLEVVDREKLELIGKAG